MIAINYNEHQIVFGQYFVLKFKDWRHNESLFKITLRRLTQNLDDRIWMIIQKCDLILLVILGNYLVQQELSLPNEFVFSQILLLGFVCDAKHSYLKQLLFFESILDVKVFDPLRIQIVVDDLSHANHVPFAVDLLAQDRHSISPGKRVHIWEIDATDRQSEILGESFALSYHFTRGSKYGFVNVSSRTLRHLCFDSTLILVVPTTSADITDSSCN